MQWLCERRKKERWGETGLERVGGWVGGCWGCCFYSMIHPFMIQKKRGATVFLCGKMENTKKRKGINLPCDASSHIWLPNLRSVMFHFAVEPVPASRQLQRFTAISWHVVKKSIFSFFPAPPGTVPQCCQSPGLITGFCTAVPPRTHDFQVAFWIPSHANKTNSTTTAGLTLVQNVPFAEYLWHCGISVRANRTRSR